MTGEDKGGLAKRGGAEEGHGAGAGWRAGHPEALVQTPRQAPVSCGMDAEQAVDFTSHLPREVGRRAKNLLPRL